MNKPKSIFQNLYSKGNRTQYQIKGNYNLWYSYDLLVAFNELNSNIMYVNTQYKDISRTTKNHINSLLNNKEDLIIVHCNNYEWHNLLSMLCLYQYKYKAFFKINEQAIKKGFIFSFLH